MEFMSVKPAPGRSPRHEKPPHAPIRAAGEIVPATPYYLRQMEVHGDTINAEMHPAVAEYFEPVAETVAPPQATKPKSTRKPNKEA